MRRARRSTSCFNSRTHGKHIFWIERPFDTMFQFPHTRETLLFSPGLRCNVISIPAHTGNIKADSSALSAYHFQFPHTRETFNRSHSSKRLEFQFPHTRETFVGEPGTEHPDVSIPAHTGNMTSSAFPSSMVFFQFPHTRETFVVNARLCPGVDFNSRTHGKHCIARL